MISISKFNNLLSSCHKVPQAPCLTSTCKGFENVFGMGNPNVLQLLSRCSLKAFSGACCWEWVPIVRTQFAGWYTRQFCEQVLRALDRHFAMSGVCETYPAGTVGKGRFP